jgi:hypothetical protein
MQQESDLEIQREIHFIGIQRGKKSELIQVEYIDFGIWFLDLFILFWDSIDSSNRGFGELVQWSSTVLSLMSGFPTVKAQIIIHVVFPFFRV